MQDLPKELVESHYPSEQSLPDYFTNTAYVRFTPEVDCLALPGEQQPHFWIQCKMAELAACHAALGLGTNTTVHSSCVACTLACHVWPVGLCAFEPG